MNEQIINDEIYFEQNQPEIQEEKIVKEAQLRNNQHFSSCLIHRNKSKTSTLQNRKTMYISANNKNSRWDRQTQQTIKRKMTIDNKSSKITCFIHNQKYAQKYASSNIHISYHQSKKPKFPFDSISPDHSTKKLSQSKSPDVNRKSLYWQSWLLEKKQIIRDNGHNQTKIFSSLKFDRQSLPILSTKNYIAMIAKTKQILIQLNEEQKRQIASLTKIMTAYTVICICNTYGINLKQHRIVIHKQASYMEGTSANLKIGQEILIIDLLYGLLLPSGNDAGIALAQYFGKFLSYKYAVDNQSHQNYETCMQKFTSYLTFYDNEYQNQSIRLFVFEMNKNSHNIGLKNTIFANPTGLSNSKNVSTAKDVALLTAHCLNNRILREIFCRKKYVCEIINQKLAYKRQIQWKNTNKHLYQFKECIGVKTGITLTAGPCLSSAYKILDKQIVIVVLNSASVDDRYEDAKNLYKWCRRSIKVY